MTRLIYATRFLVPVLCSMILHASEIPHTISHQGILTSNDGNPVDDGMYSFTVGIYELDSSTDALWTETQTVGVINGIYNLMLGIVEPLDLGFDTQYWIGISVNDGEELQPRIPLGSVPYAFHAQSVPDGSITSSKLADESVTQEKIHPDVSLPISGNAGGDLTGTFPDPTIAEGSVNTSKLADGAVTAAKIANGAITSEKLANNAVTTAKIVNQSVTQEKLHPDISLLISGNAGGDLTGTYPNPLLAEGAVTTQKIEDGAVTSVKINSSGAIAGQGLMYDGSTVTWGSPDGEIELPFSGSLTAALGENISAVFDITNPATTTTTPAIRGSSYSTGTAIRGTNNATGTGGVGVWGSHADLGWGVWGSSSGGTGVLGTASASSGTNVGVFGSSSSTSGTGVIGTTSASSGTNYGVYGQSNSTSGRGVYGVVSASSGTTYGVYGQANSPGGIGVYGEAPVIAIAGTATQSGSGLTIGVQGASFSSGGAGVWAVATTTSGVNYGINARTQSSAGYAGYFSGRVHMTGNLSKGGGSFEIDHPLSPETMILRHSFVESPDMMNVYNGNVVTDAAGEAVVRLPDYFEALNKDFRYQLTVIGEFAQVIIAEEIMDNRFVIRSDIPNVKVSWQVTGIRKDRWAEENRIVVEEYKSPELRGFYLHPAEFGLPETRSIEWGRDPEGMKHLRTINNGVEFEQRLIELRETMERNVLMQKDPHQ